jgi:hypothetical protein
VPARPSRRLLVPTAVVAAVALVTGTAYLVAGDAIREAVGGTYSHRLVRYDDDAGERNRFLNLPDGQAQLSLGSPDGHRLVVQWRDPDGSGWTAPETVYQDRKNRAVDSTVRVAGGTVAIVETYTGDVSDDSDIGDVEVVVVCRDLSCDTGSSVTVGEGDAAISEPELTPDGRVVLFGWSRKGAIAWEQGAGFSTWTWRDPFARRAAVSRPVLAPDGSLRLVRGRLSREGGGRACTYTLLTSEPGAGDLRVSGRTTARLPGRRTSECRSYLQTYSADWVGVEPDDHATDGFWFVRDGDRWTSTSEDPSGLVQGPDLRRNECCELGIAGFIGWDSLAYGSPDGRRITVQAHFQGEESWEPQQVLPGAPPGYRCTFMEGGQVGDEGYAVYLVCHSGPVENDFRGDAYAVAVSTDLRTWETFFVRDVVGDVLIDQDVGVTVAGRPHTSWRPDEGVVTLGLPQPPGSAVARADDGTYVRLTLAEGPDGCTGEAVVAQPGDTEWSEPIPGRFTAEPRARCRVDYVNAEDGTVRFALSADRATRSAIVERDGDGWRLFRDSERG